jgi:hypothetical protein
MLQSFAIVPEINPKKQSSVQLKEKEQIGQRNQDLSLKHRKKKHKRVAK